MPCARLALGTVLPWKQPLNSGLEIFQTAALMEYHSLRAPLPIEILLAQGLGTLMIAVEL